MVKVLPAILSDDIETFTDNLNIAKKISTDIHIDIMDGNFVPSKSISINELKEYFDHNPIDNFIEIHLMVEEPVRYIETVCGIKNVTSVVLHKEAMNDAKETISLYKMRGKKVGLSIGINNEYDVHGLTPDFFFVLSIDEPGYSGTPFSPIALSQIELIRKLYPNSVIEVDGGINDITGKSCVEKGATTLIANSYLLKSDNIMKRYNLLSNLDKQDQNE